MEESSRFELEPQGFAVPRISRFAMTPLLVNPPRVELGSVD